MDSKNIKNYVILDKGGKYFGKIPILNGNREDLIAVAADTFIYPLEEEEMEKIKIHIDAPDSIKAPIKKGDNIGNIHVFFKNGETN